MKEYLTINEFSKISGIKSSTLRHWEEIELFKPVKRDPETNYRYYTPEQLIMINFIVVLQSLNIPLKTIRDIDLKRNPEEIIKLIDDQEKILNKELRRLQDAYSVIHTRRELINQGLNADPLNISIEELPEQHIIVGPKTKFPKDGSFYNPFIDFCKKADELHINLNYPIGGSHGSFEDFVKAPGEPNNFFSKDPGGNQTIPAGKYLVAYNHGYYGNFNDTVKRMTDYTKKHNISFTGPLYAIYLHDEICITDPTQYLAQIFVKIK